jgi:hypothetical protein
MDKHITQFTILSLLVVVFFSGSFSDNLAFAKVDEKQVNAMEKLLNDLISTIENLSTIIAQLQADITELKNNEGSSVSPDVVAQLQADVTELKNNEGSSVSPIYVNSETITTAASNISTYNISCNTGDVAQSGSLIKLDNPKKFLQVFYSYQNEPGSWEFQVSNTHNGKSLDAELSIICLRS